MSPPHMHPTKNVAPAFQWKEEGSKNYLVPLEGLWSLHYHLHSVDNHSHRLAPDTLTCVAIWWSSCASINSTVGTAEREVWSSEAGGCVFLHLPRRPGRQSVHNRPDFEHEQLLHRPLPLHRQHEGIVMIQLKLIRPPDPATAIFIIFHFCFCSITTNFVGC